MTEELQTQQGHDDAQEDFATLFAAQEAAAPRLQTGQKVTGKIIEINGDSVFVDVGIKVDGVMDRKDILDAEGKEMAAPGDSIEVWVVGVNPHEIRLSRSMSGSGMAALEEACQSGVPVDGRVVASCKGGYTVEVLGKTAFCPGSQMDAAATGDAESVVGRTMQFVVLRVENRGRNIVVSRRALLERERQEKIDARFERIENVVAKMAEMMMQGIRTAPVLPEIAQTATPEPQAEDDDEEADMPRPMLVHEMRMRIKEEHGVVIPYRRMFALLAKMGWAVRNERYINRPGAVAVRKGYVLECDSKEVKDGAQFFTLRITEKGYRKFVDEVIGKGGLL